MVGGFVVRNLRQAIRNTQQQTTKTASDNASDASAAAARSWKKKMDLQEARAILNVEKQSDLPQINERFETLFKRNDIAIGGSFYLQSKIYNAKQRLEEHILTSGGGSGGGESEMEPPSTGSAPNNRKPQKV